MISWAATFLIMAIIAGVLGFSGIAGAATQIAWIAFVIGIIYGHIFLSNGKAASSILRWKFMQPHRNFIFY